jgi:S-adenosylmethionine decarboxylase
MAEKRERNGLQDYFVRTSAMSTPTTSTVPPGQHLLVDFWGAKHLTDQTGIETALCEAAEACGATVLKVMLHAFGEGSGITGVAILAESHISIHTWPELDYAALDIFMCGVCDPQKALPFLRAYFEPTSEVITSHNRGRLASSADPI